MRILKATLLVSALAVTAWAKPALADPPAPAPAVPSSSLRLDLSLPGGSSLWATPQANVASLAPIRIPVLPRPRLWRSSGGGPLRVTGAVVLGLGLATLFGAGVTAIVAAAQSSRLGDECPNKICTEGTRGAEILQSTRDTAYAADWLVGIGGPVTASGTVMMLYSAVVERDYGRLVTPSPVFRASPGSGGLMFHF